MLSGVVASSNRQLGSGVFLSCVILSPTCFWQSSMSLTEDELLSHPCDQALTTHPCGPFGFFCFSIISFVSTVKQKPPLKIPCPLSFTSLPPVSSLCMISSASVLSLQKRDTSIAIWFLAPEQTWVSADLGIFVPSCGVQYKICPPAEMLCWMGTKSIERRLGMFGSRYHDRVERDKILLQFYPFPETSPSVRFGALLAIST